MAKIIKQECYVKDRDKASQSEDTNNETDCPCYVLIFVPDCTMIPFFKESSPEPFLSKLDSHFHNKHDRK